VTVSEDGRPRRPRFSADEEERAALGDEAWALQDRGKGLRTIQRMFNERGIPISHATVAELISEAQDRAKFLDYVGPAQSRAASIGRLGAALERQIETIESHAAALQTGELGGRDLDYDKAAAVLDKAMARYVQLEQLWVKVTGAAMPTRNQLDINVPEKATPDRALLDELRKVTQHEREMEEMEANDGLMD
jgi:hypothetical protein